jgi:UDP-glucose 4-epimerase
MKSVLVTGGAGYIGSHTVQALVERGYKVAVIDNLSTGHRAAVSPQAAFYQGDIADGELVRRIILENEIDAVVHFAAKSLVPESMRNPALYFHENTSKTLAFLSALLENGVKKFVMSSTAAVYGIPDVLPITEESAKAPINTYGKSKLMIEEALGWMEQAHDLRWIALRYFNACGAASDGSIGEDHTPESHLIPLILQTALGQREVFSITGTDYQTPDGTNIRDYIHVLDLAEAHIMALEGLERGVANGAFNVGSGHGYSVREIVEAAKKVTGIDFPVTEAPRRGGDPDSLVAHVDKIKEVLGFESKHSDLQTIIETAWNWHRNHPSGYGTTK